MKICFLAAGNSVHSYRWIHFFAERGHEVHWLSLTGCDYPPHKNIHFLRLGQGTGNSKDLALAALRIRGVIRRINPDIVHAHYVGSYGLLGLFTRVRPFVLTAWGSDIHVAGKEPIKGRIIRWVLARADLITCDAHHMIEAMRRLGAGTDKIRLVFFGVETDRFCPGDADTGFLSQWGAKDRPVVISLRNLEPIYDIETLIDAIPIVAQTYPAVRVIIAGAGSREQALKARVASLGLTENVLFIGRYANPDLPRMLRTAQVYVSTSLSDAGIAASTAEAMACGLPVVVTNTGENDQWITDGETGFLIQAGDSHTLAKRVVCLLGNAPLREAMGKRARRVIEERNDYIHEMEKMENYYNRLLTFRMGKNKN